ncbi:hypothetical protein [Endozoicomonas sp.]|uniref:hypothetical protein n=1 Tax=Endozoicomonas sp. TaxID=1892382 RepID=UPI00383A9D5B
MDPSQVWGFPTSTGKQYTSKGTVNHHSEAWSYRKVCPYHGQSADLWTLDQDEGSSDSTDNQDPRERTVTLAYCDTCILLSDFEEIINDGTAHTEDIPVIDSNQQMTAASGSRFSIDQNDTVELNSKNLVFFFPETTGLSEAVESGHSIVSTDSENAADLDACDLLSMCQDGVSQPPAKTRKFGNNFRSTMGGGCQLGAQGRQMEGVTREKYQDQNNPLPENTDRTNELAKNEADFLELLSEIDFFCDPSYEQQEANQEVAHLKAQLAEVQGQYESQKKQFEALEASYRSIKDNWQSEVQENMALKGQSQKPVRENEVLQLVQSDDPQAGKQAEKLQAILAMERARNSSDMIFSFQENQPNKMVVGSLSFTELNLKWKKKNGKYQAQVATQNLADEISRPPLQPGKTVEKSSSTETVPPNSEQLQYPCPLCQRVFEDSTGSVNVSNDNHKRGRGEMNRLHDLFDHIRSMHGNIEDQKSLARKLVEWRTDDTASNVDRSKNRVYTFLSNRRCLMSSEGVICGKTFRYPFELKKHQRVSSLCCPSAPSRTMKWDSGKADRRKADRQYTACPGKPVNADPAKPFSVWREEIGRGDDDLTWVKLITGCLQGESLSLDHLVTTVSRKLHVYGLSSTKFKEKISYYLHGYDCFIDTSRGSTVKAYGGFWQYTESLVTNSETLDKRGKGDP